MYYISDSDRHYKLENFNPTCYDYNTNGSLTVTSAGWHNGCGYVRHDVAETYQIPCDNYFKCSVPVGPDNLPYGNDLCSRTRSSTEDWNTYYYKEYYNKVSYILDPIYTCNSKYLAYHVIYYYFYFIVKMNTH